MTVGELIAQLSQFAPDTEVTSYWDCMTHMPMNGVVAYDGRAVIDCYSHGELVTPKELAECDGGLTELR